jgi:hypothetical protein
MRAPWLKSYGAIGYTIDQEEVQSPPDTPERDRIKAPLPALSGWAA